MHYLIYQITNIKNGKVYIGCHQTIDPDDGYTGSGKLIERAIKKHGIEAFIKTILHDFDSPEAMFAKEAELVNEEFVARSDTYNIKIGGSGGWDYINNNREKLGNISGLKFGWPVGKAKQSLLLKTNAEWKKSFGNAISEGKKKYYTTHQSHWVGKLHSLETKRKQSEVHKGLIKGSKNPLFGKKWMTNGIDSKPATKEEQEMLLTSGWRYGRIQIT